MQHLSSTTLQRCIITIMSFISTHTQNLDTKPASAEEKKNASTCISVTANESTEVESAIPSQEVEISQGVDVQRYIHSETPVVSEKEEPKIEMEAMTEEKETVDSKDEEEETVDNNDEEKETVDSKDEEETVDSKDEEEREPPPMEIQEAPNSLFLLQRPPEGLFASTPLASTDGLAVVLAHPSHR